MAIVSLSVIKNWFRTGLIPTEAQFWDTWDSYYHKLEKIPASAILELQTLLDAKCDNAEFEHHKSDTEAHPQLLNRSKIYTPGTLQVFKRNGNVDKDTIEVDDFVVGIVQGNFIKGLYIGGDTTLLESYTIIESLEF